MRRLPFAICLVCLLMPLGAARAEEERPFQFGLESRFSEAMHHSEEFSWSMIPNFSYHLTERFRLDAFAGITYSDDFGLGVDLQPGFRYYLGPQRGKFRFNTGLSVGFTLIDDADTYVTTDLEGNPEVRTFDDDDVWLRAVPLEMEYWGKERWGLTMALDYQTRFGSEFRNDEGFGLSAGFRFKIR